MKNLYEDVLPIKISDDVDFDNNTHYDYICGFLDSFMNRYLLDLISYLFNKHDVMKENSNDYSELIKILNNTSIHAIYKAIINNINEKINVNLLCLCASHINNTDRLNKLENMLNTWYDQYYKTKMILSMSYDNDLHDETMNKINHLKSKFGPELVIFINSEQKTQFQHYKNICDIYHDQFKDYWVYFTDDDDIWSLKRSFIFGMMIQNIINEKIDNLISYIEYPFFAEDNTYMSSNEETINNYVNNYYKLQNTYGSHYLEYICYSLRFYDFKKFNDNCDNKILSHEMCDRYFIKYLKANININKSSFLLPFWGPSYYYFNSKYLDNYNVIRGVNDDDTIDKYTEYIIISHYTVYTSNERLYNTFDILFKLQYYINIKTKNKIFKKCVDLSNSDEYLIFKNSPILSTGKH